MDFVNREDGFTFDDMDFDLPVGPTEAWPPNHHTTPNPEAFFFSLVANKQGVRETDFSQLQFLGAHAVRGLHSNLC